MPKTRPKTIAALDVQHETKNIMKDFHDKLNNIQAAKFGYEIDILDLVNKFFNDMNARGEEELARCLKAQSTFELTTDADKLKITSYAFRYLTALIVANYSTSEILQYFIPALAKEEVNVKPEKSSDSWRITYWFQLLGYYWEFLFGKKKYKVDLSKDKYYRIDLENALKNVAKFMIETMAEKGNSYVSLVKNSIFFVTELDVLVEEVIKRKTLEVPVEEVIKGETAAVKSGTDDIFAKERVSEAAEQLPVVPPPPPPPETKPESKKKPSDSEPVLRMISTPDKSTNQGTNNDNNTTEIITIAQIHSVNSASFASRSRFGQANVALINSVNSETETSAEPKKVRTTEVRTGGDIYCSLIPAAKPTATTPPPPPPPPPTGDTSVPAATKKNTAKTKPVDASQKPNLRNFIDELKARQLKKTEDSTKDSTKDSPKDPMSELQTSLASKIKSRMGMENSESSTPRSQSSNPEEISKQPEEKVKAKETGKQSNSVNSAVPPISAASHSTISKSPPIPPKPSRKYRSSTTNLTTLPTESPKNSMETSSTDTGDTSPIKQFIQKRRYDMQMSTGSSVTSSDTDWNDDDDVDATLTSHFLSHRTIHEEEEEEEDDDGVKNIKAPPVANSGTVLFKKETKKLSSNVECETTKLESKTYNTP